ncbi:MAG TPA: nucleoside phosphorylase [Anaerolineaceae bacterium]|nr:nucleoside phosphorylase [Anaerolineaceae bacterium]
MTEAGQPPILANKRHDAPSVFTPEKLLREARRQQGLAEGEVPRFCILDPDGDIVQNLVETGLARRNLLWACYHTTSYDFSYNRRAFGIVPNVVGASFAVLVAEELFASGCQLLVSITSAGQILDVAPPPYFVLIEKALRDEGTSYHYLPPSDYCQADPGLLSCLSPLLSWPTHKVLVGATWTTDAPFRETAAAIDYARMQGILGVEMEAAALYAFAQVRKKSIICFALITNCMGSVENDFEKGDVNGSLATLELIDQVVQLWDSETI